VIVLFILLQQDDLRDRFIRYAPARRFAPHPC
jgi:hypothetical protein